MHLGKILYSLGFYCCSSEGLYGIESVNILQFFLPFQREIGTCGFQVMELRTLNSQKNWVPLKHINRYVKMLFNTCCVVILRTQICVTDSCS